ncbi:hypothetical protein G6009_05825 [Dietzia sp. SLG510A3-30A2]|nr:hypothetical protein [Dietzia sp. SLG510A3-30A2]
MNTGMIGADPRVLREMAASFDGAADKLIGVKSAVQVWVDRADIWRGLDNRQFADGWGATDARAIANAATILRRCADTLRANACAQDSASAEGGTFSATGLFSQQNGTGESEHRSPRFSLDLSTPEAVHSWMTNVLKTVKLGADAIAFANHLQLATAAADGNIPSMVMHFMHEADAALLSEHLGDSIDKLGHAGNVLAVLGSIDEITSDSVGDKVMGGVHILTAGLNYAGPVGKAGASVIGAFESVMPTTAEQQADVVSYGIERMYPGVAVEDLTPQQMSAVAQRYDGVAGFGNMLTDTAGLHVQNGVETVTWMSDSVSTAAGRGYSAAAEFFGWGE